jgi:hypothetical protein
MKARTWSKAVKSHKISNFFLQNPIPIWWFFAKSILFLLHFLWALLVRKMMDGKESSFTEEKMKEKQ